MSFESLGLAPSLLKSLAKQNYSKPYPIQLAAIPAILENRDVFAGVKLLVNGVACAIGNFIGGFIIENLNFRGIYVYGFSVLIIVIGMFYLKVSKIFGDRSIILERYNRNCTCRLRHKYIERRRY